MSSWTLADSRAAIDRGWMINSDFEIDWWISHFRPIRQDSAHQHVVKLARNGDTLAAKAISYVAYKRLMA